MEYVKYGSKRGNSEEINKLIKNENLTVPFLWKSLGSLIDSIKINKNENKADLNAIKENLKKLKDAETKLYKTFGIKEIFRFN